MIGNRYEIELSIGSSFLGATCDIGRRSSDCESLMYAYTIAVSCIAVWASLKLNLSEGRASMIL